MTLKEEIENQMQDNIMNEEIRENEIKVYAKDEMVDIL